MLICNIKKNNIRNTSPAHEIPPFKPLALTHDTIKINGNNNITLQVIV